jgi:hypothetical protein
VAFEKSAVGCSLEARLVEQLWLWVKLISLTSGPHMS